MKLLLIPFLLFGSIFGYSQTYSEIFKAAAFDRSSEDRMGRSVDVHGNYAIIGAYGDDFGALNPNMGSAYIFEKTGIDNWEFVQKISNSDQDDYDRFGWSVSIWGEFAVIGSYGEDHDADDGASLSKAGSAYVFHRGEDGVWTEMQKLVASDRDVDDQFGWAVDIYDSTIVIGAHHEGHNASGGAYEFHAGSAYLFDLSAVDNVWYESQKIVGSDRADDIVYPDGRPDPTDEDVSDLFGGSVAIWGDYLVVGSHMHDYGPGGVGTGAHWNQGAAYVFERVGGVWTEANKIQSSIRHSWDRFGYAVDIDSSIVMVGVWSEDESEFEAASLKNAGGVYVFERDGAGDWLQIQKLDASDRTTGDHFGKNVAIDGDYLVVGAEQEDIDGDGGLGDTLSNAGAAYIFIKDEAGVWSEIQKITASDRRNTDLFGDEAVAISNHTILVGAWQQDLDSVGLDSLEDAGAAYFYSYIVCEEEFFDQDISICAGDSITIGENVYLATGIYSDTLLNMDACDSIVTTNLTVIEPVYVDQDITICSGTTYSIGDSTYSVSGLYTNTLVAFTGCDSVVTTNLTIEEAVTSFQEIYLCYNETYTIGESIYTETGIYEDSLVTDEGCDSIVTTDLFIENENLTVQELTLCAGDSIMVGGIIYNESGEYMDTLVSATLCDSVVHTFLEVLLPIDVSVSVDLITLTGGDPDVVTTTFQWMRCEPFGIIDGAIEQTYEALVNGNYSVIITDGECTDTSDCISVIAVGIESFANQSIRLYPNPTDGQFTIEIISNNGDSNLPYTVLNNIGAIIHEGVLTDNKTVVDLSNFANGMYIIKIVKEDKIILHRINKK